MDDLADRLEGLNAPSLEKYHLRVARLIGEGYGEEMAKRVAAGIPPDDILHWPANMRYDLAELEGNGMVRDAAIKEVRRKLDDWWFNTHSYE